MINTVLSVVTSLFILAIGTRGVLADDRSCDDEVIEAPSAAYPFVDQYVSIDGYRIHYIEQGPPSTKPIILVHGNTTWS